MSLPHRSGPPGRSGATGPASALVSLALVAATLAVSGCAQTPTLVPNQSPTITLTSGPVDTVSAPQTWIVDIAWTANDPDGSIDRFDYAIDPPTHRQAFANRAETTWIATRETQVTVRFRAATPDTIGPGATASDFHTFVLRAVDNDGGFSPLIIRAFYAYTVAPDLQVTNPAPSQFFRANLEAPFRLSWTGDDPDGAGSRRPVGYRVRILMISSSGEGLTYLLDPDSLRREAIQTNWAGWIPVPGESTSVVVDDSRLVPGAEAMAAVVALDEAGATTPYMRLDRNLVQFVVLAGTPPRLHVWSPAIDYTSTDGRFDANIEILTSQPHTLHWEAFASPGHRVWSTRWMLDGNINDPSPRSDEATDWTHWSAPQGASGSATFGPLTEGEHRLYLEVQDDLDRLSLYMMKVTAVRAEFTRDLLVVDDTRLEPDKFLGDPQRQTPDLYAKAWPSSTELDTFLFARGGFPWRGTKNPPSGVTSMPGLLAGFAFDTLGTRRGLESPDRAVPLSQLANYRHVLWIVDASGALNPWPSQSALLPPTSLRAMCSPGRVNPLVAYIHGGGRVWLAGGGAALASLMAFNVLENDVSGTVRFDYAHGELIPGRLMYDVGHVRTELSVASAPTVPERSPAARGGWSGHGPDGTLAAPDYSRLPAQLRPRSPDTDPMPPTRLASQTALFYTQNGTQEFVSAPNEIVEDMDAGVNGVRMESTLDSLYEVSHSSFATPRGIAMTYYHGREHAPFVFTGLPLWAWTRTDAQGLVDFVLQDLWGLTRSGPSVNRAAGAATPPRRVATARSSGAAPR